MQLGRKMVQLRKKMVQSGKNETCDSRPGAPEGLARKKRRSPRLDAPGEPWRSMHGPRPGAPGYRGEKDAQPLTQCSRGTREENARPSVRCSRGTREENPVHLRDQGGK